MWYSAYGVDDERVTLILSPGVMVSFSDSGQYWALFSCGAGHTRQQRESDHTVTYSHKQLEPAKLSQAISS